MPTGLIPDQKHLSGGLRAKQLQKLNRVVGPPFLEGAGVGVSDADVEAL
jgi:hypothetical protein